MKKLLAILALALPLSISAQTTNTPAAPNNFDWLKDLGQNLGNATNYSFAPYVTYAPDAPRKYGGGLSIAYDVNENVGVGTDIDWLGSFQLVHGNITLKQSFRPLQSIGWTNFVATPFAKAGLGTPLGGADADNGALSTVTGAGITFNLARLKGWDIGAGYGYNHVTGAGAYSGNRHNIFVQASKGF